MEAGILTQVTVGRRNRAFEAPELIETATALERQLGRPKEARSSQSRSRASPRARYTAARIFPLGQKRRVLRYRFSEDLEFTVLEDRPGAVRAAIERVLDRVSQEFGIRAAAACRCVTAFLLPAETVIWTQLESGDL